MADTVANRPVSGPTPSAGQQERHGGKLRGTVVVVVLACLAGGCGARRESAVAAPLQVERPKHPVFCPGSLGVPRFDARDLLRKRLRTAQGVARRKGCTLRVVERDGRFISVLQDGRVNRIDVGVAHGRVTYVVG